MKTAFLASTTSLLLLPLASAFPAIPFLGKRQYCAPTSQVCVNFCCTIGTHCVVDSTAQYGYSCQDEDGDDSNAWAGSQTYTTAIVVSAQEVYTVLSTYTVFISGAVETGAATPVAPADVTSTTYDFGPTVGLSTVAVLTGTYIPPAIATGSGGSKITFASTYKSTGTFRTAVPTGTLIPGIAAGATSGGGGGLSAGAIGGIIGGIIGGVGLLALLCLWCCLYGLCAAFRKRRGTSESSRSTVIVEHHPAAWVRYVPGGRIISERMGLGTAAVVGGAGAAALAANRHERRKTTTTYDEKRTEKSGYGRYALIAGSLGSYWLYERFVKRREDEESVSDGRRPSGYTGGGVAGYYQKPAPTKYVGGAAVMSESSYSSSESRSESGSSVSSSSSSDSYFSHSSSSSGVRSVD